MTRKTFLKTLAAGTLGLFFAAGALALAATASGDRTLGGNDAGAAGGDEAGNRIIVTYFSHSGNTRALAETIAENVGGRLVELVPAEPYPAEYRKCTERAKKEIAANARPPLKSAPTPETLAEAEIVFVGSPNWLGTYAPPVATFLDTPDLAGKTVVPFFTNGGGGFQNCETDMKKQLGDKATFLRAFTVNGKNVNSAGTRREVRAWLNEIGFGKEDEAKD